MRQERIWTLRRCICPERCYEWFQKHVLKIISGCHRYLSQNRWVWCRCDLVQHPIIFLLLLRGCGQHGLDGWLRMKGLSFCIVQIASNWTNDLLVVGEWMVTVCMGSSSSFRGLKIRQQIWQEYYAVTELNTRISSRHDCMLFTKSQRQPNSAILS